MERVELEEEFLDCPRLTGFYSLHDLGGGLFVRTHHDH